MEFRHAELLGRGWTLGSERNIPNSSFLAGIDHFDDALILNSAIAADPNRLVLEFLRDFGELF
jgi:hypothetical protein